MNSGFAVSMELIPGSTLTDRGSPLRSIIQPAAKRFSARGSSPYARPRQQWVFADVALVYFEGLLTGRGGICAARATRL